MVVQCKKCSEAVTFGAACCACKNEYHFQCVGVTEQGFRKLGDRKLTWRCPNCKADPQSVRSPITQSQSVPSTPGCTLENIMAEISKINLKLTPLINLAEDVKSIKNDLQDLKKQSSDISNQMSVMEARVQAIEVNQTILTEYTERITELEAQINDNDQWLRSNNVEIKGVPMKANENLFDLVSKIGSVINYNVTKTQLNYVTRVPSRNSGLPKPIIVSFLNRYAKEDFIAASRISKGLTAANIGFGDSSRIYINDHLTMANKQLLTKAKQSAKNCDFQFIWVKHSKIMARKNATSKVFQIRSDLDISKIN